MRVLQISDTHLGAERHAIGPTGWSRAADHHEALERALAPALREEVDLVVHAGDVFDRSRPPTRWMMEAGALLEEVARRVPMVGIAGNHDRRGIRRWLPKASTGFVDRPSRVVVGGIALGLVPFVRHPETFQAHAAAATGPGVDILVIHQAPHGSRVPGLTFEVGAQRDTIGPAHLPEGIRWVMCGHIHPRQVVQLGEAEVVMGGSTERTSFVEADQPKGTVHWCFDRKVSHRFVEHATRPMADVPGGMVRCPVGEVEARRAAGRIVCPVRASASHRRRPSAGPLFAG